MAAEHGRRRRCLGASALALKDVALTLPAAAAVAAAALVAAYLLLPAPKSPPKATAVPWWDIPARMLSTFALVAVILVAADLLGPRLSGMVSTYPVMVSVICAFTHHQLGSDTVRRLLRGLALSLLVFVVFFMVVGLGMPTLGLGASFLAASALMLATHAVLLAAMRGRSA